MTGSGFKLTLWWRMARILPVWGWWTTATAAPGGSAALPKADCSETRSDGIGLTVRLSPTSEMALPRRSFSAMAGLESVTTRRSG